MSYLVFARKYRPADFSSVSGQEHVTRTLSNAIKRDKVPHAILLAGPRGVGKTSIARIFSKALNCEKGSTPEPCLKCTNCLEITQGSSLAVREIDGASNNSVDNVRELIESFRSLPAPGYRYKIYIIDEVHMLSLAAFNALLKSLEEPPPNTVFILATTEAHKIPETVISRCQRHDLRALSSAEIEDQLLKISNSEKLKAEKEALRMIARLSDGSMRDAQSLFERIQSFCDGQITASEAGKVLGVVERKILYSISEAILQKDAATALATVDAAFGRGIDISIFLREFVSYWRELMLVKFGGDKILNTIGISADDVVELRRQVESLSFSDIHDLFSIVRETSDIALRSSHPRYALEALLVRLATRERTIDMAEVLARLKSGVAPVAELKKNINIPVASHVSPPVLQRASEKKTEIKEALLESEQTIASSANLDWRDFVRKLSENGSKVLSEYVKRLSVKKFAPGILEAIGTEFTVVALEKGPYREKLISVLNEYCNAPHWNILLERIEDGANSQVLQKSVLEDEKTQRIQSVSEKKKTISDHPQIKRLQKVFPGSAIEDIKIKE